MHYAQSLLNRLHKKSWWKNQGSLKDALLEPNEEVLKSLRNQYPRPSKGAPPPAKGGGKGKGAGKEKPGKNDWSHQSALMYPRGRGDDWTPQKQGQRRDTSDRSRSRERKDAYKHDLGKDGGKGKDGGRGGSGKGPIDPRVRRIYSICKDKREGKYPYYQCKTCQFSAGRCSLGDHKCFLCGGNHGAIDCHKLSWDETKKTLGMS